ncbi:hypothetical protein TW90_0467 [Neisseria flavescens]|nr:hypothetical protein NEIFL0001_1467 [Neisseria flavescens SK114]KZC85191.1 hypothetical protein TW90_0467 [Neisseria flavescens]
MPPAGGKNGKKPSPAGRFGLCIPMSGAFAAPVVIRPAKISPSARR